MRESGKVDRVACFNERVYIYEWVERERGRVGEREGGERERERERVDDVIRRLNFIWAQLIKDGRAY